MKDLSEIFPQIPSDIDIVELDLEKIPQHVAIIMDGNGRWAKAQGKPRLFGHKAGVDSVREVVRTASDIGIKYLTVYSFSTENWNRPEDEVSGLMELFAKSILAEMDELHANNVRVQILGDISPLPKKTREAFEAGVELMKNNTGMTLLPAVNYGSRDEILRAVGEFAKNNEGKQPTEEEFSKLLYTHEVPDPELLIRTSGELRVSNFLLWQIAYSEFYVTETLWPDFDRYEFLRALIAYQKRDRRFGGV
ncbi:MAG: isoprenyl transferase [Coriobacteriia bacterium]|nr:isoprenyl transferase [Coriobacteriia bacterium]